jgi:HSP20 family protein
MTHRNGNEIIKWESAVNAPAAVSPHADVYETPDAYVLVLDMPGAIKDRISVSLDQDNLVVEADSQPGFSEGGRILANEIRGNRFHRVFVIGQGIQRDAVDARFENGVLTVKLFKAEETKPKQIAIH